MYKVEDEIFTQATSLRQTCAYLQGEEVNIKDFFGISGFFSITFTGCGTMYALCKSAELSLKIRGGLTTMSYAAGDLMLNAEYYRDMLNGTLMIVPSRSGQTSEVLSAVQRFRVESGAQTISICPHKNSKLAAVSDLALEMPWILDETACATRTATNIYLTNLYIIGLLSGDLTLLDEIREAVDHQEPFIQKYAAELEGIGQSGTWDKIIVIADGELAGVAQAGMFTIGRMCGIPTMYSNIMDIRHSIIGQVDSRTLAIVVVSPLDDAYQGVLLYDLSKRGAQVMTISSKKDNIFGAELNVTLPEYQNYGIRGIPLLFSLQAIAFNKAVCDGKNPDTGDGSPPWIRL
ncbi:MAG: SIS domain-containing protein [Oscillospiraceae bacterium]|jgi:fructoselysine-6-P-deglycase FrlB-like protein|nr:SIS domain-containing protein [Oscillospiraceae bacterium]